jgi:hypothetical protein
MTQSSATDWKARPKTRTMENVVKSNTLKVILFPSMTLTYPLSHSRPSWVLDPERSSNRFQLIFFL